MNEENSGGAVKQEEMQRDLVQAAIFPCYFPRGSLLARPQYYKAEIENMSRQIYGDKNLIMKYIH